MFKGEEKVIGGLVGSISSWQNSGKMIKILLIKNEREGFIKLGKHDFMKNRLCQIYLIFFLQL